MRTMILIFFYLLVRSDLLDRARTPMKPDVAYFIGALALSSTSLLTSKVRKRNKRKVLAQTDFPGSPVVCRVPTLPVFTGYQNPLCFLLRNFSRHIYYLCSDHGILAPSVVRVRRWDTKETFPEWKDWHSQTMRHCFHETFPVLM